MAAEIVNLRLARKARERAERQRQAAENREKFGRSKAERALTEDARLRLEKLLDRSQRDKP